MNNIESVLTGELIAAAIEIGRQMLISGAETYRVEESIQRLCAAYGAVDCQAYAVPTTIIVTAARSDEKPITRMIRVHERGTDLRKLDELNALCRRLCADPQPLEDIYRQLEEIDTRKTYPPLVMCLAYGGAAGFFALIFSYELADGLVAFAIGVCLRMVLGLLAPYHINRIFENIVGGIIIGSIAYAASKFGLTGGYKYAIIGGIMPLIPGLSITNSMRDIIAGDSIAGLNRLVEVVLMSTCIAVGVAIPLSIGRMFW